MELYFKIFVVQVSVAAIYVSWGPPRGPQPQPLTLKFSRRSPFRFTVLLERAFGVMLEGGREEMMNWNGTLKGYDPFMKRTPSTIMLIHHLFPHRSRGIYIYILATNVRILQFKFLVWDLQY